jgi:hypothetical protein
MNATWYQAVVKFFEDGRNPSQMVIASPAILALDGVHGPRQKPLPSL